MRKFKEVLFSRPMILLYGTIIERIAEVLKGVLNGFTV